MNSSSQRPASSSFSGSIKSQHPVSRSVTALRSHHDNRDPYHLNSHPQLRPSRPERASVPKHPKNAVSLEKGPHELVAVVANKRTPSGKSSHRTRLFHTNFEVVRSVETSRLNDNKFPPNSWDAAVQASPPENTTDSGLCKRCLACRNPPSTNQRLLTVSRYENVAVCILIIPSTGETNVQRVTVESQTQTSAHSSPGVSDLGSAVLSDGSLKADSFASSEVLSDEIDHLFDRASFSIHGGSIKTNSSTSPSIDDPVGLRRGLNVLLNGPSSSERNPHAAHNLPLSPTRVGNAESESSPIHKSMSSSSVAPAAIASISGVLFADPFASFVGQRTPSESCSIKYAESRTISGQRPNSSVPLPTTTVPPVPAIPDKFRQGSLARLSEIQPSSSLARRASTTNGSYLSEVIHPRSPVRISSGFSPMTGKPISLRPHQDFVFTEPPNPRTVSRSPGSPEYTPNWVKGTSDAKFQVFHLLGWSHHKGRFHVEPPQNYSPDLIPIIRRPSLRNKIVSLLSSPSSTLARPSALSSETCQAKKTRRRLQRKSQQSQSLKSGVRLGVQ